MRNLLSIDCLEHWNAAVLKEGESAIRDAAMVLAGQCVALLLSTLAEQSSATSVSRDKTQGVRSAKSQSKGRRQITITTLGNVTVPLTLSYVSRGATQEDAGRRSHAWISSGFYPFWNG